MSDKPEWMIEQDVCAYVDALREQEINYYRDYPTEPECICADPLEDDPHPDCYYHGQDASQSTEEMCK